LTETPRDPSGSPETDETERIRRLEQALEETRAELRETRREKQQREAEAAEYYEEMFRKNTAPKLLVDPQTGYIADANPAALDFYGYSLEAIRNRRIQDINLLSAEEVQAEWEKAWDEQRRYFEFRHQLADGEIRDVKVYSGPIEIGGRQYLHSIIHDVTDAKQYLSHLERYKAIFDTLPVGVFRNQPGPEGSFAEVNPAMAHIFGAASEAELLHHTTAELYADPQQRQAFSDELLAEGEIHRRELDLQTVDGRPVRGAITARLRYTEAGEPFFDGVIEDVTERYRAEQERSQALEILEATPDFVGMADVDGNVLYLNRALREALGGQLDGGSFRLEQGHPEWAARNLQEEALPAAARQGLWQGESALLDAEGNTITVSQTVVAHYDEQGRVQRYSTVMHDVSEARAAEVFRRQLLDSLAEGVFGLDTEGRFTFLNPAACRMLGFDNEAQVLGHNAHALTHHTHADGTPYAEAECPILRVQKTDQPLGEWEDWFWRADGTGFPVAVYAAPLHDVAGDPEGVVVSFLDIRSRKAAEAARDRVLAILDATPDVVSMAHTDGSLAYINRAGLALIGEDTESTGLKQPLPERLQGAKAGPVFHPDWVRQLIREEGTPTAIEEGVWRGWTAVLDAEGREIPTSQVILAHFDERGEVAYFATILRDISAQRELESELRRETTFNQALVRNLPGIFYLIDTEGRFVRWNRRLEQITGHEGENELAAVHPTELYPEAEQELITERIGQVFREGSANVEAHLRHRDGTLSPYYLTGFRVELEGEPYLLGVGLDISERKAAEAELERSNAELEAFAYAVSHDLQEPLRIINSYLGLLQRRYGEALDERAGRYIAATTDASERMRRMIADLLEYSRIKRMGEEFRPVDLDEVVREAYANLETAISDSGAEITVDPLPTVTGDRGQLVRLLQNLLSNAIKYGPAEDVPRISVSSHRLDGHWEIAVADNGLGIDPKQADRVFQVFQRLHTRDEHEGTGAGLALAQRIVERHGGQIWLESAGEGSGSTFRFTIPAGAGQ
jgi:PAS domain S-box-containing protein